MSIDIKDAEVQLHFTNLRKSSTDSQKGDEVNEIIKMYERSDDYSYGVYMRQ